MSHSGLMCGLLLPDGSNASLPVGHAAHGAAYLLYATSGPAFPDKFKHEDGGTYTGEWRGLKKEGFGVYL